MGILIVLRSEDKTSFTRLMNCAVLVRCHQCGDGDKFPPDEPLVDIQVMLTAFRSV
jgi:hypothetical protein